MEPNEFTVSAEAHAQLAALSGDLAAAFGDLESALSHLFSILGNAAAASLSPDQLAQLNSDVQASELADGEPEQLSFDLD